MSAFPFILSLSRPFIDPMYGSWNYWRLLLLPLALGVAMVYKSIRCEDLSELPRQTLRAFLKFVLGFLLLAAILWVMVLLLERETIAF